MSLKKYIYSDHKYKDHRAEQQDLNAKPQGCFRLSWANVKAASHNTILTVRSKYTVYQFERSQQVIRIGQISFGLTINV